MSVIVEQIQQKTVEMLSQMLTDVLTDAEKGIVDQIGGFLALSNHRDQVIEDFVTNMNGYFDELLGKEHYRKEAVVDFETLSIIQEEELEVMVAVEGMVAYSRNQHLPSFISFNTRLNHVISDQRIDEATNPLDPHQVASAFQEAIRPLNMDAGNSLFVYRAFNAGVLRRLDEVIHEANQLLIQDGVIPNMGMDGGSHHKPPARSKRRHYDPDSTFGTVEEEDFQEPEEQPELFSMMQNLLHGGESHSEASTAPTSSPGAAPGGQPGQQQYAVPAGMIPKPGTSGAMQPYTPQPGEQVQMVDQAQLMEILTSLQKSLARQEEKVPAATRDEAEIIDIAESLDEVLKNGNLDGAIQAFDAQSSDVINLVTMLYEAIWDDDSVPIPIKELIGRTQITIIRVALSDQTFFNREGHPARMLLNEFAAAGIGWTEVEKLQEDPLYRKMQELVNRMLDEYEGDVAFFEELIRDFKSFQAREAAKTRRLEQRILKATERQDRLDDIHELVTQKINERILGRDLHPFVEGLLEGPFHRFMVLLVVKEGPGGNAWKQAVNTIDVLLWSVPAKEHH
ncbi:MAG: DUF1631 family protein, partial [Pseudomonadales bacterium]|nr:DUF1631 family protein [Pseudomonadales bacterium]